MIADGQVVTGVLSIAMTVFVVACVMAVVLWAAARWVLVFAGKIPTRKE
jgi:hypothetical protein